MITQSKWQILAERRDALLAQANKITAELEGMERTPFHQACVCGEFLATEAEFAKHFLVNDIRWLNLGRCPVMEARRNAPILTDEEIKRDGWRVI